MPHGKLVLLTCCQMQTYHGTCNNCGTLCLNPGSNPCCIGCFNISLSPIATTTMIPPHLSSSPQAPHTPPLPRPPSKISPALPITTTPPSPPPPTPPSPPPPCFPSSSKVTVAEGKTVTMSELQIGDQVLAGMRLISVFVSPNL